MKLFYLNLKQALRYMQRDILQYSLSTGGMILGLVCLTFSINWLWNETHYDSFRPGHEDIYAVAYLDESKTTHGFQHSYALYDYLRDSVPEIKSVGMSASVYRPKIYTEKGDDVTQTCKSIRKITPSLLTLFHVELLYGDTRTALQEGHIILSRQAAVDIFGRENVVGERLKVEDRDMYGTTQKDYTVSGIAADVPEQTNLDFDMLLWLDPDKDYSREQWGYMAVEIYYSSDHPEQAAARVSAMPHYNRACAKSVPLSEMHVLYGAESWWRGIFYPLAFTVVSFLMIASALFNYMAILTARFLGRIREYKLRLTLGGTQLANVAWLTTEVLLLLILVLLISGVMLELLTLKDFVIVPHRIPFDAPIHDLHVDTAGQLHILVAADIRRGILRMELALRNHHDVAVPDKGADGIVFPFFHFRVGHGVIARLEAHAKRHQYPQ